MSTGYRVPAGPARAEIEIARSRFVASLGLTPSADDARAFIYAIRQEFPAANHHVYAFRAGFPPSVIEGMSDDGEPTGTAGPPVLAVVRGASAGDFAVVVTRYFGGTKLGTGGLVRAYTEAAQTVLHAASFHLKRDEATIGIEIPYALFDMARRVLVAHDASIEDESFAERVTIVARIERDRIAPLSYALSELSAGQVAPILLD